MFKNAEEGSIFQQIWDKNGGDDSNEYFTDEITGLEMLLKEDKTALFYTREGFLHFQEFRCEVLMPWKTKYPAFLTMGFPKNSPYFPFFNYQMMHHFENGVVPALRQRWLTFGTDHCKDNGLKPLGLEKLISLFGLLAVASIAAIALFLAEKILALGSREGHKGQIAKKIVEQEVRERDGLTPQMVMKLPEVMTNYGIVQKRKFISDMTDFVLLSNTGKMQKNC